MNMNLNVEKITITAIEDNKWSCQKCVRKDAESNNGDQRKVNFLKKGDTLALDFFLK